MKKNSLIAMFLSSLVFLSSPAVAKTHTMTVEVEIPSTYTLTIPAGQQISYQQEITVLTTPLKISGNLQYGKAVRVDVATRAFQHQTSLDAPDIIFTLLDEKQHEWMGDAYRFDELEDEVEKNVSLTISITKEAWNSAKSGEHEGGLIFTASLQDQKVVAK